MRRAPAIVALTVLVIAGAVGGSSSPAGAASAGGASSAAESRIAPVVVRPLSSFAAAPVTGTDGTLRTVYELTLVNTRPRAVPIVSIDVRTVDPRVIVASFAGPELASRLRRFDGSTPTVPVIEAGESLFLFVDLPLVFALEFPVVVDHRVTLDDRVYNSAAIQVAAVEPLVIQSPVEGSNWVVTDGCCVPVSSHRAHVLPTDVGFSVPGRYAVDLRKMDDLGRFVTDDPGLLTSYPGYGQYVYAVAPGQVVSVSDGFDDQPPGAPPTGGTFDEENREGNSVVIALRDGGFAYYGQLQPGSIIVKPDDFVRRGQPIAKIGNSGDSVAPHLHFEIVSAAERVGAEGIPFVLSSFAYAGQIDAERLAVAGFAGQYADNRVAAPQARRLQLPLDLAILDFESRTGNAGSPLV